MPELPEVETTVRALRPSLVGQTFTDMHTTWPRHIVAPDLQEMRYRIRGRKVRSIGRRGKYIVIDLSEGETLIVHLKMSGHLSVVDKDAPSHHHVHTVFGLSNGQELRFRDQRKFGRIYLVRQPEEVLSKLGPEPLEPSFTLELLKERIRRRRRTLKPLLLDQAFIAGVGNIYANEALFYAGLHPTRTADTLSNEEIEALYGAIRKALNLGLENEGASIDQYIKPDGSRGNMQNVLVVHGLEGAACIRCQDTIERDVIGGRSAFFCPGCQL